MKEIKKRSKFLRVNVRRSKYNNKKVTIDNITFDSEREGQRYLELKHYQRIGCIKNLKLQVRHDLYAYGHYICFYRSDFEYFDMEGKHVIEDVKGVKTASYRIKNKLMEAQGFKITEILK